MGRTIKSLSKFAAVFGVVALTATAAMAYEDSTQDFIQKFYPQSLQTLLAEKPVEVKSERTPPVRRAGPLRVALDPGHLGGAYAWMEDRLIVQEKDGNIRLSEGDLALEIALNLKKRLEQKGVEVFLTRKQPGVSIVGGNFDDWKKSSANVTKAIQYVAANLAPASKSAELIEYWTKLYKEVAALTLEQAQANPEKFLNYKKFFNQVYLPLDRDTRVKKINAFSPDITFIIHLNVNGPNNPRTGIYKGTTENIHMAFVPGGISAGELQQAANVTALQHQLENPKLQINSLKMCEHFTQQLAKNTSLPFITEDRIKDFVYLDPEKSVAVSSEQQFQGVFARNLSLNRSLPGLSCYGESFMMDNVEFATKMQDATFHKETIDQIAKAYYAAFVTGAKLLGQK